MKNILPVSHSDSCYFVFEIFNMIGDHIELPADVGKFRLISGHQPHLIEDVLLPALSKNGTDPLRKISCAVLADNDVPDPLEYQFSVDHVRPPG